MASYNVVKLPHHEQNKLCETRPAYRQGRKLTAVKVYTINNESRHLIVDGVPKLQLRDQVKKLFSPYGDIKLICALNDYPCKPFEEAFHIHYGRIQSARIAKHFIDRKNFYGGLLHVFYAPELETLSETREKLAQRRKDVSTRIQRHKMDPIDPKLDPFMPAPIEKRDRKKKHPALLSAEEPIYHTSTTEEQCPPHQTPNPNFSILSANPGPSELLIQPPYSQSEAILKAAGVQETKLLATNLGKRKNYKGRTITDGPAKAKVFKPQLVDTTTLLAKKAEEERDGKGKQFVNVKKVDRGIIIRIPKDDVTVKRIVMKNSGSTKLLNPSDELQESIHTAKEHIREAMLNQIKR